MDTSARISTDPADPRAPAPAGAVARADLHECRRLLRGGSHSFFIASMALPHDLRAAATALYAYCRIADDVIDAQAGQPPAAADALAGLHRGLDRIYAGAPGDSAVERAFAAVVERFAIPRELPAGLLEGFAWDAAGRRYATLAELRAYGARVAGTVGAMMALLMGVRAAPTLARACDLGVAMQLTNIARDVGEDARAGRLYLPLDRLAAHGVDAEAFLAAPRHDPRLGAVIADVLAEADPLYARAAQGIAELPRACRPGMHAARMLYAEIGREVERNGHDAVTRRAVVAPRRKAWLLAAALAARPPRDPALAAAPALAETAHLVAAAARAPQRPAAGQTQDAPLAARSASPDGNLHRVLDMFERIERIERGAGRNRPAGVAG